jgi:hypothetical protein
MRKVRKHELWVGNAGDTRDARVIRTVAAGAGGLTMWLLADEKYPQLTIPSFRKKPLPGNLTPFCNHSEAELQLSASIL